MARERITHFYLGEQAQSFYRTALETIPLLVHFGQLEWRTIPFPDVNDANAVDEYLRQAEEAGITSFLEASYTFKKKSWETKYALAVDLSPDSQRVILETKIMQAQVRGRRPAVLSFDMGREGQAREGFQWWREHILNELFN